jgi:hypothetical protein
MAGLVQAAVLARVGDRPILHGEVTLAGQ